MNEARTTLDVAVLDVELAELRHTAWQTLRHTDSPQHYRTRGKRAVRIESLTRTLLKLAHDVARDAKPAKPAS